MTDTTKREESLIGNPTPVGCAHTRVVYSPEELPALRMRERWKCEECGEEFIPKRRMNTRAPLSALRAEVGGLRHFRNSYGWFVSKDSLLKLLDLYATEGTPEPHPAAPQVDGLEVIEKEILALRMTEGQDLGEGIFNNAINKAAHILRSHRENKGGE